MRARCTAPFWDLEARAQRKPGDEFECSQKRFDAINAAGYGTLAERAEPRAAKRADAARAGGE